MARHRAPKTPVKISPSLTTVTNMTGLVKHVPRRLGTQVVGFLNTTVDDEDFRILMHYHPSQLFAEFDGRGLQLRTLNGEKIYIDGLSKPRIH